MDVRNCSAPERTRGMESHANSHVPETLLGAGAYRAGMINHPIFESFISICACQGSAFPMWLPDTWQPRVWGKLAIEHIGWKPDVGWVLTMRISMKRPKSWIAEQVDHNEIITRGAAAHPLEELARFYSQAFVDSGLELEQADVRCRPRTNSRQHQTFSGDWICKRDYCSGTSGITIFAVIRRLFCARLYLTDLRAVGRKGSAAGS
ncbi:hypothetical protein BJ912DRAFT_930337 [Pholiota molesta]|nr:hypothetical protein BJ912DRAFT_930337 [Pholiota molesta]